MKLKLHLNGHTITQKKVKEIMGTESFKRMLTEAEECFREDPYEEISWAIYGGILVFEFV